MNSMSSISNEVNWKQIEEDYYMFCVRRQPMVIVRGKGSRVWDQNGKEYLDFVAGWAVNNVGHSNENVAKEISKQANTLLQTSNQFYTVPQLKLAQVLVDNCCMDKIFFANSGAEANEGAIKLARKYGKKNLGGAYEVITAVNSFHGRTLTTWAATGKPHEEDPFQPLPAGFVHVAYNDVEAIKKATTNKTAAIMIEPVQGEGGVNIPDESYLKSVREWCDQKGILLIFDEVQTGMGRLGTLFGYQKFGVEPDVMTLAKGLGGGVPIGALLAKNFASVLEPGDHGSTFGGNALACAAALASTNYLIENNIVELVNQSSEYLLSKLSELQSANDDIIEVRGMGLLFAVQFSSDISADVINACNELGLLLNGVRPDAIRLMPPLNISLSEIDEAIEKLKNGIEQVSKAK